MVTTLFGAKNDHFAGDLRAFAKFECVCVVVPCAVFHVKLRELQINRQADGHEMYRGVTWVCHQMPSNAIR